MRSTAPIFYVTFISFLRASNSADPNGISGTQLRGSHFCAESPSTIISDACTSYLTLDKLNIELLDTLADVTRNTDFFSYYRLNLFGKECPFWSDDNGVCGNIACAVNTLDNEEQIPPIWRAEKLGKLEGLTAVHPDKKLQKQRSLKNPLDGRLGNNVQESCVVEDDDEFDERDYCVPEDESAGSMGDYVSLVDNPERFTGYAGEGTKQLWDAIYRENCFSGSSTQREFGETLKSQMRRAANIPKGSTRRQGQYEDRSQIFHTFPSAKTGLGFENECLEKRVFYRIVSGMHTSISAHICSEYLNQTTGVWGPNLQCYKDRLHGHLDRIGNLYFNFAVVLQAVKKLGPYLKEYSFCPHDITQDSITREKVQSLVQTISAAPQFFDESLMFVNGDGPSLKEDFRKRFRNVSRIMDCVGCDKCRLWGKLQTAGYGAALKILFESESSSMVIPKLKRTEIVALFNTLARISSSVETIRFFSSVIKEENQVLGNDRYFAVPDRDNKPHHVVSEDHLMKDNEFDEQEREELRRRLLPMNSTLSENLSAELEIFWKVTKFVIRSWLRFPFKLWEILRIEVPRAWNSYIGLPVKPRKWVFKKPSIDEL